MKLTLPENIEREGWMADPYTQRLAKSLGEQLPGAFANLLRACEASSDPGVVRAVDEWIALRSFYELLRKGTNEHVRSTCGTDDCASRSCGGCRPKHRGGGQSGQ